MFTATIARPAFCDARLRDCESCDVRKGVRSGSTNATLDPVNRTLQEIVLYSAEP